MDEFNNIFAVVPDLSQLESVEEGFEKGGNNFIYQRLKERFCKRLRTEFVCLNPSSDEIEMVREGALFMKGVICTSAEKVRVLIAPQLKGAWQDCKSRVLLLAHIVIDGRPMRWR